MMTTITTKFSFSWRFFHFFFPFLTNSYTHTVTTTATTKKSTISAFSNSIMLPHCAWRAWCVCVIVCADVRHFTALSNSKCTNTRKTHKQIDLCPQINKFYHSSCHNNSIVWQFWLQQINIKSNGIDLTNIRWRKCNNKTIFWFTIQKINCETASTT